jgi:hypothetical protein
MERMDFSLIEDMDIHGFNTDTRDFRAKSHK